MTITDNFTGTWQNVDGTGTSNVTEAILRKALDVTVQSLQGTFDADDNPWTSSDVKSLDADPEDS